MKMTNTEAMADLKAKVSDFMDEAKILALKKIDRLQDAGTDIVADHLEQDCNFLIPRDFMAAFADQIKHDFGWVMKEDSRARKRVKNYFRLM